MFEGAHKRTIFQRFQPMRTYLPWNWGGTPPLSRLRYSRVLCSRSLGTTLVAANIFPGLIPADHARFGLLKEAC